MRLVDFYPLSRFNREDTKAQRGREFIRAFAVKMLRDKSNNDPCKAPVRRLFAQGLFSANYRFPFSVCSKLP